LNPRHSVPQTDALPAELLPPLDSARHGWGPLQVEFSMSEGDGKRTMGIADPAITSSLTSGWRKIVEAAKVEFRRRASNALGKPLRHS
jgi:hypothetical protein